MKAIGAFKRDCRARDVLLAIRPPRRKAGGGLMAEWLRSGLQIRAPEFDSRSGLQIFQQLGCPASVLVGKRQGPVCKLVPVALHHCPRNSAGEPRRCSVCDVPPGAKALPQQGSISRNSGQDPTASPSHNIPGIDAFRALSASRRPTATGMGVDTTARRAAMSPTG